eukprot:gene3442-13498_t
MEEDKADALYRLFKKTDASARFKQGLDFLKAAPSDTKWATSFRE